MSQGKPLSPADTMRALREQAAIDAIEGVTSLPEEALDEELRRAGVDPEDAEKRAQAAIEAALASAGGGAETPASNVVPMRKAEARAPSRRWYVFGPVAAAAAVAIAIGAMNASTIVAVLRGGAAPIRPDEYPPAEPARPEPAPMDRATALREKAYESCAANDWAICAQRLDDARELDPAGEETAPVIKARRAIRDATAPQPRNEWKEGPKEGPK